MTISNYPNRFLDTVTIGGVPILQTHSGEVFFVNNSGVLPKNGVGASDGNKGTYTHPFLTLDYAIGRCTASRGDIIVLMPGHNESLTAADAIDADVAGITILGLGTGSLRPTLDYDNAAGEFVLGANNVTLKNLILRPSVTSVLIGIDIETGVTGTVLEDIEFAIGEDGAGVDEFVKAIHLTSGNHDTVFRNVKILAHASAANATHGVHVDAASDRLTFQNVVIDGPYATNGILEDAAGLNHIVDDCSVDTTGTNYGFHASSTFAKRTRNLDAGAAEDSAVNLIGFNDADNAVDTTNVVANANGSIVERLEYVQTAGGAVADAAIADTIEGAAATTQSVISDVKAVLQRIGADSANNTAATTLVAVNRDGSIFERLEDIEDAMVRVTASSTAVMVNNDDIFTIAGGAIVIESLVSICITANDATASTLQYEVDPTVGAAVTISAASASLANAAAGATVSLQGTSLATAALLNASGGNLGMATNGIIANAGVISIVIGVGSTTGTWAHYLRYRPLQAGVTVTGI